MNKNNGYKKYKIEQIDDHMFAFKTIDEVITEMNNAIINGMSWWIHERMHDSQTRHVWNSYLQFTEDCAQIKHWLTQLKYYKNEYEKLEKEYINYRREHEDKVSK